MKDIFISALGTVKIASVAICPRSTLFRAKITGLILDIVSFGFFSFENVLNVLFDDILKTLLYTALKCTHATK